ncbi:hypothetical protein QOL99_09180 [Deinococcus sp. MIMF12]|uniref:DUF3467 domain-containing protein n=1 Tax=Deinococcus rhizophilus TaxID=3049544 RepID=A0ABT7JGY4_9DEIO|nr:hypothetical protein [Deinococcus rhizophilus]MDL2344324.1 hypothetical protein [Deinococcus rhizophilus]
MPKTPPGQPRTLTLRWVPGTNDRVQFERGGRTFTVLLVDVQRTDAHTLNPLYLRGVVTLPVTLTHLATLMGPLRQHVTPRAVGTAADAWVQAGGQAGDEPDDHPPG